MIIKTGRFGQITVTDDAQIIVPQGLLGFPELTKYFLVDPQDDTLILWLQSLDKPELCFPVLEPKIFKPDYIVKLSALELRELKLEKASGAIVLSILTIPEDVTKMTANLKAPVVINLNEKLAKQVVLQENEFVIKHQMFKELRTHLLTIQSQQQKTAKSPEPMLAESIRAVSLKTLFPSSAIRGLSN